MKPIEAPAGGCTVRMYRQGLGDCFLLAFGAEDGGQKYMLIDCGVLTGTSGGKAKMQEVADDICQATGNHLHVLAITHEHWDHVSGFDQAKDVFDKLKVDEVWLAWTEDPDNALARELGVRKKAALKALETALSRMDGSQQYTSRMIGLASFEGLGAKKSVNTEKALEWVKQKWTKHRYIKPGGKPLSIPGLPAARFFALGPPADKELISDDGPAKGSGEVYLGAIAGGESLFLSALEANDESSEGQVSPFNTAYGRTSDHPGVRDVKRKYDDEQWRNIDNDWLEAAGELALQIGDHTNNTSLALAIELAEGGDVLLFPGDAQVGNWLSWDSVRWSGDCADITAEDLLSRTVLYKVGHHGSHNATLREKGLERMTSSDLVALIPVDQEMAAKQRNGGWEMPRKPLLKRLKELTSGRVVLADDGLPKAGSNSSVKRFLKQCSEEQLYIDVTVQGGE